MVSRISIATTIALLCLSVSIVKAETVLQHVGTNDPESEGWTVFAVGAGDLAPGTETTASGTRDYWRVNDAGSCSGCAYNYHALLSADDVSGNWEFEAVMRVLESHNHPQGSEFGTGIIVHDGLDAWRFYFSLEQVAASPSIFVGTDPKTDYHSYKIVMSQNGPGPADDSVDFFIDNVLVFDDVNRDEVGNTSDRNAFFGGIGSFSISDAHYASVSFDNGKTPQDLLSDLIAQVLALNLQQGISNSLDAKLDAALNALDDANTNNDVAAINSLNAFINAVSAQSMNWIDSEDADDLIASAEAIILLLQSGN